MLARTHASLTAWSVIRSNDKHRARLNANRIVLDAMDHDSKDAAIVGQPDNKIVGRDQDFFDRA